MRFADSFTKEKYDPEQVMFCPSGVDPEEYRRTWRLFVQTREPDLRERLIEWNLNLVFYIVRKDYSSFLDQIDKDELVSYGTVGLIHAVDGFDPAKGITFSTYAYPSVFFQVGKGIREIKGWKKRGQDPAGPLQIRIPMEECFLEEERDLLEEACDQADLVRCLTRLTPLERMVIEAYFFDDLSLREISRKSGIRKWKVQDLYHLAIDHLREMLSG